MHSSRGGVHPFCQGRVNVNGATDLAVGNIGRHRDDGFVDQVAGLGSDDVAPQQPVGVGIGNELDEARRLAHGARLRDTGELLTPDGDGVAGRACLRLGHPDGGDLRIDEDGVRHDTPGNGALLGPEDRR